MVFIPHLWTMLLVWTRLSSEHCRDESWVSCTLRYRHVLEAAALSCKSAEPFALWDWMRRFYDKSMEENMSLHHTAMYEVHMKTLSVTPRDSPCCLVHGSCSPALRISQIENLLPVCESWDYFKSLWQFTTAVFCQNLKQRNINNHHSAALRDLHILHIYCQAWHGHLL